MTNLLRAYLGLDDKPQLKAAPESESESPKKVKERYVPKEVEEDGN